MEYIALFKLIGLPFKTIWTIASGTYSWSHWLIYGTPESAQEKLTKKVIELEELNAKGQEGVQEELKLLRQILMAQQEQLKHQQELLISSGITITKPTDPTITANTITTITNDAIINV